MPPQAFAPEPDEELDELEELLDELEPLELVSPEQSFSSAQEPSLPGAAVVHQLAL